MRRLLYTLAVASTIGVIAARAAASTPVRHRRTSHSKWAPMFPPSRESLLKQNEEIDKLGISRIRDEQQLQILIDGGQLVPIPVNGHLITDPRLPAIRRYCRPWTAVFLTNLSDAFYARFHTPIVVDSAVRTIETQQHLELINGNAAPVSGDTASSHLAGTTIDISRRRMTSAEAHWVELYLLPLYKEGKVEIEEEHYQLCFHIMVNGSYSLKTTTKLLQLSDSK